MKITDSPFTNNDTEYNLIKELLLEIENHSDMDNNWDPGRMDWWRYNYHAEKGVDFFQANAHYWKTETDQVVGLFISEYGKDDFFIVVHPNFWTLFPRNGLGTALAKECFKRLDNIGVESVTIASHAEPNVSNFLYESLIPTSIKRAYRFSLNLDD